MRARSWMNIPFTLHDDALDSAFVFDGTLDGNAPGFAVAIASMGAHLAAQFDQIAGIAGGFEGERDLVGAVALGDGRQIDVDVGVQFADGGRGGVDLNLVPADRGAPRRRGDVAGGQAARHARGALRSWRCGRRSPPTEAGSVPAYGS